MFLFCFRGTTSFFSRYFLFIFIFLTLCCSGTKVEKHHADESKKNNNITSKSFLDFFFLSFYLKVGRSEEVFSFFSNLQKYESKQCPPTFLRTKNWESILGRKDISSVVCDCVHCFSEGLLLNKVFFLILGYLILWFGVSCHHCHT